MMQEDVNYARAMAQQHPTQPVVYTQRPGQQAYRNIIPNAVSTNIHSERTPYAPSPAPSKKKGFGRKPCNCSKSGCLKLYCECFAAGEFCNGCNCKGCHNDLDHEAERSKAIKMCLERNANAFQPKIVSSTRGRTDTDRTHLKGCHCKKSNCLKNYCECYEAKVACTGRCKCQCCQNTETDRAEKVARAGSSKDTVRHAHHTHLSHASAAHGLSSLAAAAANIAESELHNQSMASVMDLDGTSLTRHETSAGSAAGTRHVDPKTQPWYYMNDDVVQATTLCLTAQVDDMQQKFGELGANDELTEEEEDKIEKAVLREFGRCLLQIINNARHSGNNADVLVHDDSFQ